MYFDHRFGKYSDLPVRPIAPNTNEVMTICAQTDARFNPNKVLNSVLMLGRTCDVAFTSLDFFRRLNTYEHFAELHNFWGVSFGGEVRGLFVVSPNGYAILMTDRRSEGDVISFFETACEFIKAVDLLEDYTTDEEEITSSVSALSTEGYEAHAYSLITKDERESLRKRDLQLFSWAFPDVFKSVNDPSLANRELLAYGEIVKWKYHPVPHPDN